MKILSIIILSLILIASCKRSKNLVPGEIKSDGSVLFNPRNLDDVLEENPAMEVEKIRLESSDKNQLIGTISKTIYRNNKFYILDHLTAKAVYVFNRDGAFDFRIRKRGRGPGEYSECWDMDVDGEGNIYVLDVNQAKIIQYGPKGNFVKEHPFEFWTYQFSRVAPDTFSFYQMSRRNPIKELAFNLLYWTTNQHMTEYYFPYNYTNEKPISSKIFFYQRSGNEMLFTQNFNDTIYSIAPGGARIKYIFNFGKEAPVASSINGLPPMEKLKKLMKGDYAWNVSNYFENDTMFGCTFYYKKRFCMLQYSKLTKQTRYFKFNDMEAGGYEYTYIMPNSLCDGKYVGYLVNSHYAKLKNKYMVQQLTINKMDTSCIGNNKFVNPLLFLYKFK